MAKRVRVGEREADIIRNDIIFYGNKMKPTQQKTEFNLSKKLNCDGYLFGGDVKEFIRRLKEINFTKRKHNIIHSIDKLAGEKLCQ